MFVVKGNLDDDIDPEYSSFNRVGNAPRLRCAKRRERGLMSFRLSFMR